jgi:hypothetical protein
MTAFLNNQGPLTIGICIPDSSATSDNAKYQSESQLNITKTVYTTETIGAITYIALNITVVINHHLRSYTFLKLMNEFIISNRLHT